MCSAKLCSARGCVAPAAAVAGLLGGNVTRARVTPTLRRSGYTLSREERAGRSRERGETRRRAGEQSGYNTHRCCPTRPPALTKTSYKLGVWKNVHDVGVVQKLLNDELTINKSVEKINHLSDDGQWCCL